MFCFLASEEKQSSFGWKMVSLGFEMLVLMVNVCFIWGKEGVFQKRAPGWVALLSVLNSVGYVAEKSRFKV